MSLSKDVCVCCLKTINNCHKLISCKICKLFVHKKCTKLKPRELKKLNPKEWLCNNCSVSIQSDDSYLNKIENLNVNVNVTDTDFDKYDKMVFNPLRYECMQRSNGEDILKSSHVDCTYVSSEQLSQNISKSNADFTLFNLNIRSLNHNFDKLNACLKGLKHNFAVIGLTETQLKGKPYDYLNIPNYNLEFVNRVGKNSGGVCLYIRKDIKYKLRTELCKANSNLESCFIEIDNGMNRNILVGVIYRSHESIDSFNNDMDAILQIVSKENKNCYMLGDFNIDLLKEETHRPISDFLDLIYANHIIPSITKPTRITETSATIIDNILTNSNDDVLKANILVTDITDHFPTVLFQNFDRFKQKVNHQNKYTYKRNHTNDNIARFKKSLMSVNWKEILEGENTDVDYNNFMKKFSDLYDECIPLKKITTNRRKTPISPWITKGLLKSINTKNKLYKQYLQSPSDERKIKFKTYRNKLNNLMRKCKREYYHKKFENTKNNIKQTWSAINTIIGKRKTEKQQSTFKTDSGNIVSEPESISNSFNDFFVNIGPKLASEINHTGKDYFEYLKNPTPNCVFMKPIISEEIIKIVSKFNQNKSPGHDGVGNFIVKKVIYEISGPLTDIFNLSLSTGIVPHQLKVAKVIPIYKKDDADVFSNYRPVSVLPCLSKILERLVFNRCIDYIDKNNVLNEKQFGFRSNHSTYMAVIELVDKIVNAVEKNETTVGIFLDLSKAFDTINHDILLYKLEHYGFRGVALEWFKNYLANRKQFVRYQMHDSDHKTIQCGVPQGSILGPLLFILYINDIVNATSLMEIILFADDTTLLFSHPDIASQIDTVNNELQEICNWFQANKLSVNASKTNYMVLGTKYNTTKLIDVNHMHTTDSSYDGSGRLEKKKINIKLDGVSLNRVSSTKFLGVIIDENLTWKNHIDAISKTISRNTGMLTKLKHFLPENILHSLYCTLILPYINYGVLIWGNTYATYLDKVLKLQKWAIRTVSNSHYRSHTGPLFNKFNVLNVHDTFKLNLGTFMYKHYSNLLPSVFTAYFIKHNQTHDYRTRNAQDYSINKTKKVFSDRAVRNCGPTFWNSLSNDIKGCNNTKQFRNKLKSKLLSNYI